MLPASTTMSAPSGSAASSTAIASRYRMPGPSCGGGCSSVRGTRPAPGHRRPAVAGQRRVSSVKESAQIVGVDVGARHDTAPPIRSSRSASTPARRPARRAPSPSAACRPAGTARSRRSRRRRRDAHHPGDAERRRRSESRRARDILGVGHGGHPRPQHRAQLLQLGARVVAGDLLAGDDRDRAVGMAQRMRDRPAGRRGAPRSAARLALPLHRAAEVEDRLLNVLGQQQHRGSARCGRGDRLRQRA